MATVSVNRDELLYPLKYHNHHLAANSKFIGYTQKGSVVTLMYDGQLVESEMATIMTAEANYIDSDPFQYVLDTVIRPARAFGQNLIDEFVAENVLLGITQVGLTSHVRKTMREVQDAVSSGSLYDAIVEIKSIPTEAKDPVFLSDARILKFINKIEAYLRIPLSTSL